MKKLFMLFCAVASVTAFPAAAQTLSAGTYNVRQLNAGDDARGVTAGIDFMRRVNGGQETKLEGRVVVIGGGNIACR